MVSVSSVAARPIVTRCRKFIPRSRPGDRLLRGMETFVIFRVRAGPLASSGNSEV